MAKCPPDPQYSLPHLIKWEPQGAGRPPTQPLAKATDEHRGEDGGQPGTLQGEAGTAGSYQEAELSVGQEEDGEGQPCGGQLLGGLLQGLPEDRPLPDKAQLPGGLGPSERMALQHGPVAEAAARSVQPREGSFKHLYEPEKRKFWQSRGHPRQRAPRR